MRFAPDACFLASIIRLPQYTSHPGVWELTFGSLKPPLEARLPGAASPWPGYVGVPITSLLSLAPPAAVRKRGKSGVSGTPRTPTGTLRSLHPCFRNRRSKNLG